MTRRSLPPTVMSSSSSWSSNSPSKHGLRAKFMPKPFMHLTGSGCHAHVSLWDGSGEINLFDDPAGELGLSSLAYQFLGGILAAAEPLTALFTPTVNSFKRINAAPTRSG